MKNVIILIVISIVIISLIGYFIYSRITLRNQLEYVQWNDSTYLVRKINGIGSIDSAKILDNLKTKGKFLIGCLDSNLELTKNLKMKWENIQLSEGPKENNTTSYTFNKKNVVLCLRNKDNYIHQSNLLFYVLIHEMAHIGSKSLGHTKEFYKNFNYLLKIAKINNMYYEISNPTDYCGMLIKNF
jgi:hypothetical protein